MKFTFKIWLGSLFKRKKLVKCCNCANYIPPWINDEDCKLWHDVSNLSRYRGDYKEKTCTKGK